MVDNHLGYDKKKQNDPLHEKEQTDSIQQSAIENEHGLGNCSISDLVQISKRPLMVMVVNKEALEVLQSSKINFFAVKQSLSPSQMTANNGYFVVVSESDVWRVKEILERTSTFVRMENMSDWLDEGLRLRRSLQVKGFALEDRDERLRPVARPLSDEVRLRHLIGNSRSMER